MLKNHRLEGKIAVRDHLVLPDVFLIDAVTTGLPPMSSRTRCSTLTVDARRAGETARTGQSRLKALVMLSPSAWLRVNPAEASKESLSK